MAADALEELDRDPAASETPVDLKPYLPPLPSPDPDLKIDVRTYVVTWRGQKVPNMTPSLFGVLDYLRRRPEVVRTREELLDAVWTNKLEVDLRVVDNAIKRLRRRFEAIDPTFDRIQVVWGIGYKWANKGQSDDMGTV